MSGKNAESGLSFIQSIEAIAQTGLAYAKNHYDNERYQQLLELVAGQYAQLSGASEEKVCATLFNEVGYATPKICVRGVILQEQKLLLVKERQEEKWSLPGGWADINLSPTESLVKEVKEETGFDSKVLRMLALWDKQKHAHPAHWPHTYLAFYHCQLTGGGLMTSYEISEIGYFSLNELPELSTHRVTSAQLEQLINIVNHELPCAFE